MVSAAKMNLTPISHVCYRVFLAMNDAVLDATAEDK